MLLSHDPAEQFTSNLPSFERPCLATPTSQEEYLLLTSRLHTVLRPFMLRRLKETVAGELPGKVGRGSACLICGCWEQNRAK